MPAGHQARPRHASVGNFCFQQVGIDASRAPSRRSTGSFAQCDPSRDGIQADIAFTGATTPSRGSSGTRTATTAAVALLNADMVFAAPGIADTTGDGGFAWQVVGLGTAGKSAGSTTCSTPAPAVPR